MPPEAIHLMPFHKAAFALTKLKNLNEKIF